MESVLYISYDGILEAMGQAHVTAYLTKLSAGRRIFLVSYEKPQRRQDAAARRSLSSALKGAGIEWTPLRYHRTPSVPATAYDVGVGLVLSAFLVLRHRIAVVHARSYVPAVIAWVLKRALGTRFIFDMRGFWADQRVECGAWHQGAPVYRLAKLLESRFLRDADVIVSLTSAAVEVLRARPDLQAAGKRMEVITTCTDLDLFRPSPVRPDGPPKFTLGFVGTVTVSYLFDDMLECYMALKRLRPSARLVILNQGEHPFIRERLATLGVPPHDVTIAAVDRREAARRMAEFDAGLFLLKPYPSLKATAPTKLGEFLACGVPCLSNGGIGDFEDILEGERVGVILASMAPSDKAAAVERLLALCSEPGIRERCRSAAESHFSLAEGVARYEGIYRSLSSEARA